MKPKSVLLFCIWILMETCTAQVSKVYINEILASNTSTNVSYDFSEYCDWIEIVNFNPVVFDISGYYLSDDAANPYKWKIPDHSLIGSINAKIFWADGRDTLLHTNFKLDKEGEFLGLFDPSGKVVDSISFGRQRNDISFGRLPNDINTWGYFSHPTPLKVNSAEYISGFAPLPEFSIRGGFYKGNQILSLSSGNPSFKIRYTVNGEPPDETSRLYTEPIILDSTTAIRAKAFSDGMIPSEIVTQTYFIDEEINLPVVSIVTDPDNFFDDKIGIYVTGTNGTYGECDSKIRNVNQDWERPVNFEFYETTGEQRINQLAGIKIFGGCSRTRYPQKSLALFARKDYGKGSFEYKFFVDKNINKFESILLRSASDDQVFTMFRDGLAHTLLSHDLDIDYQAFRPAVVFLNGEYWGIHNIREKINENYFEENYDVPVNEIDLLERNANVLAGTATAYNNMINFVRSKDLSQTANYEYIKSIMDVDQYINYQIGHIYLAEKDWPGNNIRYWKANSGNYKKWRWINYDMDQVFIYTTTNSIAVAAASNGPSWPNPPWSTLLFRRLLMNTDFKNKFIQSYAYLMNTLLEPGNVIHFIDSLHNIIDKEIPRHITKWGGKIDPDFSEVGWKPEPTFNSVREWEENVEVMREFARNRQNYTWKNMMDYFKISDTVSINISSNIPDAGKIKFYKWLIPSSGSKGKYFKGIPFTVKAEPYFGYRFLYWKYGDSTIFNSDTEIKPDSDSILTAYFEQEIYNDSNLVIINEINYNSSSIFNSEDWIELYNRRNDTLDLSGWILKDENEDEPFVFPGGTEIKAKSFLVVCKDTNAFNSYHPLVKNKIGNFSYGLNNRGEVIRLYSVNAFQIDSVHYDNKYPWPIEADGTGATLELKDPWLDNDNPANWISAAGKYGTPGYVNSTLTGVESGNSIARPFEFRLYQNYPNPFNPITKICFSIPYVRSDCSATVGLLLHKVTIKIYNILGNEIATLVNEELRAGEYEVEVDGSKLPSGIYFYQLSTSGGDGNYIETKKMCLIK